MPILSKVVLFTTSPIIAHLISSLIKECLLILSQRFCLHRQWSQRLQIFPKSGLRLFTCLYIGQPSSRRAHIENDDANFSSKDAAEVPFDNCSCQYHPRNGWRLQTGFQQLLFALVNKMENAYQFLTWVTDKTYQMRNENPLSMFLMQFWVYGASSTRPCITFDSLMYFSNDVGVWGYPSPLVKTGIFRYSRVHFTYKRYSLDELFVTLLQHKRMSASEDTTWNIHNDIWFIEAFNH